MDAATSALAELQSLFATAAPVEAALGRLVRTAVEIVAGADGATITLLHDGTPATAAVTDERYLAVDQHQYAAGRGPCLAASETHRPVRATVGEHRAQWPEFAAAAERVGITTYLSVPLVTEAEAAEAVTAPELVGSLNLYSHDSAAFEPFDEALLRLFTVAGVEIIDNGRRWKRSQEQVRNLEIALQSRAEIDQAKGVLMAVHGCTADEAFARLVGESQHRNVKVRQLAREFLDSITHGNGPATGG